MLRFLPSIPDLVATILILGVPLRGALDSQDTAAHLRVGETILRTGQLPRVEQWSYTLAGQPLVLSGWLSDVLFAAVVRLGGLEAVVLLVTAVLAVTYAGIALLLRRRGVDARVSVAAVFLSIFLGTTGWSVRPHVFSYLGTALLLSLLERREHGTAWQYALLFLLWANLHGGFVYGLALLALHGIGAGGEAWLGSSPAWRPAARTYLVGLAVAFVSTLCTPYGLGFYAQIHETLADPRLLAEVQEYAPPDLQELEGLVFYGAVAASIVGFALLPNRPSAPILLSTVAFLYPAMMAQRHVPLFGIVVPPLLALATRDQPRRRPRGYVLGDRLARIEPRTVVGPIAALVFLLVGGLLYLGSGGANPLARFDPREVPGGVIRQARAAGLEGRVFHDPNWGGYLLYAWPEKRAYIHPLRYDLALVRSAIATNRAAPGWREELDRWGVTIALIAPTSPLARALETEPHWTVWARDASAVLLLRVGADPPPGLHLAPAGGPGRLKGPR